MTDEIKRQARLQVDAAGASSLSLRAISRDMGTACSALYRYFPSRDHLLTVLIIENYDALGEAVDYIVESSTAILVMFEDEIVGVELPAAVELNIAETEPGIQGDRVSGARKPATLETGLVIQVPLFVNPGDRVKVDTRSGEYLTRA